MPLILVTVGQRHLLNKFSFVKAYFLISVAATINCVPENSMKTIYHGLTSEKSRGNLPNLKGNLLFYFLLVFFFSSFFTSHSHSTPSNPYEQSSIYSSIFFSNLNDTQMLGVCISIYKYQYSYTFSYIYVQNRICHWFIKNILYIFSESCVFYQKNFTKTTLSQLLCLFCYSGYIIFYAVNISWFIQPFHYWCAFTVFLGSHAKVLCSIYPYHIVYISMG